MSYKKLLKEFTRKELAESLVISVKLTKAQQKAANQQLGEARKKSKAKMAEEERLSVNILGLKLRMKEYFEADSPDEEYSFAWFLKLYIDLLGRKRKEFAAEIGVDETLLSQLINQHRQPSEYFTIRLEIHSDMSIPAEWWLRIVEKDRERELRSNKAAMIKQERKFVTGRISINI